MREKAHLGMEICSCDTSRLRNQFWLELVCQRRDPRLSRRCWRWRATELTLLNMERQFGDSSFSYAWVTAAVPVGCVLLGVALCRQHGQGLVGGAPASSSIYSRTAADGSRRTMEL